MSDRGESEPHRGGAGRGRGRGDMVGGVSRGEQMVTPLLGIVASVGWDFVVTGARMRAIKYTIGLTVYEEGEATGLDISEHGTPAYDV